MLQGLGKTVTTIALLLSNKVEPDRSWQRVKVELGGKRQKQKKKAAKASIAQKVDAANGITQPVQDDVLASPGQQEADFPGDGAANGKSAALRAKAAALADDKLAHTEDSSAAGPSAPMQKQQDAGEAIDMEGSEHVNDKPNTSKRSKKRRIAESSGLLQAGTLIVAPTTLLTQWEDEIKTKVCLHLEIMNLVKSEMKMIRV